MNRPRIVVATVLALQGGAGLAHAGPCTAQIAQLEQQIGISGSHPSGQGVPRNAGSRENATAVAALRRARQADARGDAGDCNRDLDEVRRLFAIN